ncbi:MAG: S1 RNA-binding domain-containing protein, partial [Kiritimatiellae bacterium]|nr:S1 RNA-binding domain-containing protein [Kiritimatiellia bacterium]
QVGQEVEARVIKVDRAERRIGLSIKAVNMSEEEVKALEVEAADSGTLTWSGSGSLSGEQLGSLGAAFDDAFGSVEWQPGEADEK